LDIKQLITESVSRNRIIKSMNDNTVNIIYYSDPSSDVKSGYRTIEIYAYGLSLAGNPVIIAWLRNNFSKTIRSGKRNDAVPWRMYRLDRITSFQNTIQKFDTSPAFISANRPKLNLMYKSLSQVFNKIKPK
jgi:hypothetical protein